MKLAEIVRVATELADEDGADWLTIRRLAQVFGVAPMSLYTHVASKQALLDAVVDSAFESLGAAMTAADDEALPWSRRVARLMHGFRTVLLRHPGVLSLLVTRRRVAPSFLQVFDHTVRCLVHGGFDAGAALEATRVLTRHTIGFVVLETAESAHNLGPDVRGLWVVNDLVRADVGELPFLRANIDLLRRHPSDNDALFEAGIDWLVAGLEKRLRSGRRRSRPARRR